MSSTENVYIKKMNRKIYMLAGLVAALALIYTATLIFEPERINTRDANYAWLDEKRVEQADRIELVHDGTSINLARKSGEWFVTRDGVDYPAKQLRVEDLLHVLSTKAPYLLRGSSSHERFGLTEDSADRIVIQGGLSETPLLDLLVGDADSLGAVYMRKYNQDEVRSSASSTIASYALSSVTSWYNLRLFPDTENASIGVDAVQRIVIHAPPTASDTNGEEETPPAPASEQTLTRNGSGWLVSDSSGERDADVQQVESYIRGLLDIEGDDFVTSIQASDPVFDVGWVRLELGNGSNRVIRLGPPVENNRHSAIAEGGNARIGFVFALSEWRKNTLFTF
ncbi:MAG: DUF4340 domain-containing protein [Treponema sp.]|nr:DUF4340 domain-containing protein [Treponema sp.]